MPEITPSQTVGPFFKIGLDRTNEETVAVADVPGTHVCIEGAVYDGDGAPVPDALIEIWQADADGRFPSANPHERRNTGFTGFGRSPTDEKGLFRFATVKPGMLAWPKGGLQAPHLAVSVLSRGLLLRLHTRMYFEDEKANSADPVLQLVKPARRATLIAKRQGTKNGAALYRFDIHLQGDNETVFFEG